MIVQTVELIGEAIDWAVARCVQKYALPDDTDYWISMFKRWDYYKEDLRYSEKWGLAGPIIEVEQIGIHWEPMKSEWTAMDGRAYGPTPIIAAMRCFVKSKLGNAVDIPDELLNQGE